MSPEFANGAVTGAFAYAMGALANNANASTSDGTAETSQSLTTDEGGVCVDLVCRPTWKVANHCAAVVSQCGTTDPAQIEAQYSLKGFDTQFEPQDSTHSTFAADREAFLNPGGKNLRYRIETPAGMTGREFADSVIQYGNTYRAHRYGLILGPNSNSAAAYPILRSGGVIPDVPRAPALNYWAD